MAGRLVSQRKEVMATLNSGLKKAVLEAANCILQGSNATIITHTRQKGVALGAGSREMDLAGSGYIATAEKNGYDEGKAGMAGGRDDKRGLFADPAKVEQGENEFRAKVAYAAARAGLMHEGHYDLRAGKYMQGTPFLHNAAEECWPGYVKDCEFAVQQTQKVRATLARQGTFEWFEDQDIEKQQALVEAAQQRDLNAMQRQVSKEMREQWNDFKGARGPELKRQRGKATGNQRRETVRSLGGKVVQTNRFVQTHNWETAGERLDRVTESFRNWIAGGGNQVSDAFGSGPDSMRDFVARMLGSRG
jgi:hypothetical protein